MAVNDVVFNFGVNDQASSKIKGISNSLERAGNQGIKRFSGEIGLAATNAVGLSRSFGQVAIAISAATAIAGIFNKSLDMELEKVKDQHDWWVKIKGIKKEAESTKDSLAAGGLSKADGIRRLLNRGGSMASVEDARTNGLSFDDALAGESALMLLPPKDRAKIREVALNMAARSQMGYADAVSGLQKNPGNGVGALLESWGLRPTKQNRSIAERALFGDDPTTAGGIGNLSNAIVAGGVVDSYKGISAVNGGTAAALTRSNNSTFDPVGVALKKLLDERSLEREGLRQMSLKTEEVNFMATVINLLEIMADVGTVGNYSKWKAVDKFDNQTRRMKAISNQ